MTTPARFPYLPVHQARGRSILMPMLPITLTGHAGSFDVLGLVDSGSTLNVIPYSVGQKLGLVWDKMPTSVHLSGSLASVLAKGVVLNGTVATFPPVRLAFAWAEQDSMPVILGQMNFFAEFEVCFFHARAEFGVQPAS